jgi:UDP-N-acetylglucosamine--N-acetylmuramyl-(pentapeptide) pyrophosphoryl-undecaprenol N-acetylglucosamine transferase
MVGFVWYGAMKICVACGGTGGHIFPGLATACELRARGHAVTLWLAGRDVEAASVDGWDGEITSIRAAGFPSGISLRSIGVVFRLCGAIFASWRQMRRMRPDVVLGMGSYASVGPVLAARMCGVPVVLHEANAVPGRAISFLARFAARVGITFEAASQHLDAAKVAVTGFPLRGTLSQPLHAASDVFTLLVMGGSQGAHALNETLPKALARLCTQGVSLRVIHLAGVRDADFVEKQYQALGVPAEVHAFAGDMASIYAAADFAIARAGAATCTELAVCGVPALLVPHPTAARNHQALNAMAMAATGGMAMQLQQDLTVDWLVGYLNTLIEEPDTITRMRGKLGGIARADGAVQLADLVERAAQASLKEEA